MNEFHYINPSISFSISISVKYLEDTSSLKSTKIPICCFYPGISEDPIGDFPMFQFSLMIDMSILFEMMSLRYENLSRMEFQFKFARKTLPLFFDTSFDKSILCFILALYFINMIFYCSSIIHSKCYRKGSYKGFSISCIHSIYKILL